MPEDIELEIGAEDNASDVFADIAGALRELGDEVEETNDKNEEFEERVEKIAEELERAGGRAKTASKRFEKYKEAVESSDESTDAFNESLREAGGKLEVTDAIRAFRSELDDLIDEQDDLTEQQFESKAAVAALRSELGDSGYERTRELAEELGEETDSLSDSYDDFGSVLEDLSSRADESVDSQTELEESQADVAEQVEATTEAFEEQAEQVRRTRNAVSGDDSDVDDDGLLGGAARAFRDAKESLEDIGDDDGLSLPDEIVGDDAVETTENLSDALEQVQNRLQLINLEADNPGISELKDTAETLKEDLGPIENKLGAKTPLSDDPEEVDGVAATRGQRLADAGFNTVGDIADASVDELQEVDGIGPKTAPDIKESAEEISESKRRREKVRSLRSNLGDVVDRLDAEFSTDETSVETDEATVESDRSFFSPDRSTGSVPTGLRSASVPIDASKLPDTGSGGLPSIALGGLAGGIGRSGGVDIPEGLGNTDISASPAPRSIDTGVSSAVSVREPLGEEDGTILRSIAEAAGVGDEGLETLRKAVEDVDDPTSLGQVRSSVRRVDAMRGTGVAEQLDEALVKVARSGALPGAGLESDLVSGGTTQREFVESVQRGDDPDNFVQRILSDDQQLSQDETRALMGGVNRFREKQSAQTPGDLASEARKVGVEADMFDGDAEAADEFQDRLENLIKAQSEHHEVTDTSVTSIADLSDSINETDGRVRTATKAFDNFGEVLKNALIEAVDEGEELREVMDEAGDALGRLTDTGAKLTTNLGPVNVAIDNLTTTVPKLVSNLGPLIAALSGVTSAAIGATGALAGLVGVGALEFASQLEEQFASVKSRAQGFEAIFKGFKEAAIEALDPLRNAQLGGDGLGSGEAFIATMRGLVEAINILAVGLRDIVELDEVQEFFNVIGETILGTEDSAGVLARTLDELRDATEELLPGIQSFLVGLLNLIPQFIEFSTAVAEDLGPALAELGEQLGPVIAALTIIGKDLLIGVANAITLIAELITGLGDLFSASEGPLADFGGALLQVLGIALVFARFGSLLSTVFVALGSSTLALTALVKGLVIAFTGLRVASIAALGGLGVLLVVLTQLEPVQRLLGDATGTLAASLFGLAFAVNADTVATVGNLLAKKGLVGAIQAVILNKLSELQSYLITTVGIRSETVATAINMITKHGLIGAIKKVIVQKARSTLATIKSTLAMIANRVVTAGVIVAKILAAIATGQFAFAAGMAAGAVSALNAALLANPIGAIVVGLVLAIGALLHFSGALDDVIAAAEDLIRLDFGAVGEHLGDGVDDMMRFIERIAAGVAKFFDPLVEIVNKVARIVHDVAKRLGLVDEEGNAQMPQKNRVGSNPMLENEIEGFRQNGISGLLSALGESKRAGSDPMFQDIFGNVGGSSGGTANTTRSNARGASGVGMIAGPTNVFFDLTVDNSGPGGDISKQTMREIQRRIGREIRKEQRRTGR